MKTLATMVLGILMFGCSNQNAATSTTTSIGDHYNANHCEIFVDKILGTSGSHYSSGVAIFLKVIPSRLDSPIKEVGFHSIRTGRDMSGELKEAWQDRILGSHVNSSDYFYFSSPLMHDFGIYAFEGVFYVRTTSGTTYWLKPRNGSQNFKIDSSLGAQVIHAQGGRSSYMTDAPQYGIQTQGTAFSFLNPDGCY